MRLMSPAHYAIRYLLALAADKTGRPVPSHAIADAHGMPKRALANLLHTLAKAGFIDVEMGPFGGCLLARPLHEVTLLEVIEAVDGPLTNLGTVFTEPKNAALDQRINKLARRANDAGRAALAKVRLSALVQR
jgi:Rrf2 family protein